MNNVLSMAHALHGMWSVHRTGPGSMLVLMFHFLPLLISNLNKNNYRDTLPISEEIELKIKLIRREHFIIITGPISQENITILNIDAPNS